MPDPTPGQVAYEAYCAVLDSHWTKPSWAWLLPEVQRAWEAAAQAVLADTLQHIRVVMQHWHDGQAIRRFGPADAFEGAVRALASWLTEQERRGSSGWQAVQAREAQEEAHG